MVKLPKLGRLGRNVRSEQHLKEKNTNRREIAAAGIAALPLAFGMGATAARSSAQGLDLTIEEALFAGSLASLVTLSRNGGDALTAELNDGIANQTERWRMRVLRHLGLWDHLYDFANGLNPPARFADAHDLLLDGLRDLATGADDIADVLEDGDEATEASIGDALAQMNRGNETLTDALEAAIGQS